MLLPATSDLWISPLKHQHCRASGSFFQHGRRRWVESQTPTPEWHFSASGGCPRMKGKGELCMCYQGAGVSAHGHGRWELPTEIPCRESRELSQARWKHMEITYIMYAQRRVSGYPCHRRLEEEKGQKARLGHVLRHNSAFSYPWLPQNTSDLQSSWLLCLILAF